MPAVLLQPSPRGVVRALLVAVVLGGAALAAVVLARRQGGGAPDPAPVVEERGGLSPEGLAAIRGLTVAVLGKEPALLDAARSRALSALPAGPMVAYVALRSDGRRWRSAWGRGPERAAVALTEALQAAQPGEADGRGPPITAVEIDLAHSFREVESAAALPTNVHRGVLGLEVQRGAELWRFAPTEMIASNRGFQRQIEVLGRGRGNDWLAQGWKLRTFEAYQVLVRLGDAPEAVPMFRGNQLVEQRAVTRDSVAALARRMEDFLVRSVDGDGRMTYRYFPSRGAASKANNMIRQWMATLCLARIVKGRQEPALVEVLDRNVRYNLVRFFGVEDQLGLIEYQGKVKLGAVALAALALAEHPRRAEYAEQERALYRTIDALRNDDGSFRTFYRPAERDDMQQFYPGEALLAWASRYAETGDEELLARILHSYRHYRAWHLRNRNPAFVPWHTQAYYLVWQKTRDDELRDWIFEMNDWLLPLQERQPEPYPDTVGRFYAPNLPFGPPHASSTGVYLEGLSDAYALALEVGDGPRAERYRRALLEGLRNVLQLEFADDVDSFYVSRKDAVRGGIRTNPYDNSIRVDNVQHNLMAIHKVLRIFREADYAL